MSRVYLKMCHLTQQGDPVVSCCLSIRLKHSEPVSQSPHPLREVQFMQDALIRFPQCIQYPYLHSHFTHQQMRTGCRKTLPILLQICRSIPVARLKDLGAKQVQIHFQIWHESPTQNRYAGFPSNKQASNKLHSATESNSPCATHPL